MDQKLELTGLTGCRPLRGLDPSHYWILGLTPQALCYRPLRGLAA